MNEKTLALLQALAEYWECDIDEIQSFIIGAERVHEGQPVFSVSHSLHTHWHLTGMVSEIENHIERRRQMTMIESSLAATKDGEDGHGN